MINYDEIQECLKEIKMAELQDSGARTTFGNGAQREVTEDKGRCDLLPLETVNYILSIRNEKRGMILNYIMEFLDNNQIYYLKEALFTFAEINKWDTIEMILEVSIQYRDGARKYADNNWKNGLPLYSFIDSGIRHYLKWLRGDQDEPHDRAFVWNMMGAIWTIQNTPKES